MSSMTETRDLIAWTMCHSDGETMWVGVSGDYLLIGRWAGDYWTWDVTVTGDASSQAVEATTELELDGFAMRVPPMWMDVDDPEFFEGLKRWARKPHPEMDDRVCRAFGRVVVALAVVGKRV